MGRPISNPNISESRREVNRNYYYRNRERLNAPKTDAQKDYMRTWRENNKPLIKSSRKKYHLRETYGLELSEFEQMWQDQDGLCPICDIELTDPYVDHDHETGQIRELVCVNCNFLLGHAHERVEVLARAIEYLTKHKRTHGSA